LLLQFHHPVAAQLEGCKEILAIKITSAPGTVEVNSDDAKVDMKAFGGYAESEFFTGDVLPGGFDNGKTMGGTSTLSARYVLEGTDFKGQKCKIFIENNALQGSSYSSPIVLTDSKALSFLNNSELVGYPDRSNKAFTVRIFVREAKRSSEKVMIDGAVGKLSAVIERPALKAGEKCPVVIVCHGFGGTKNNANEALVAKKVVDSGKMAAVRFDFNGHGESYGKMRDMTVES